MIRKTKKTDSDESFCYLDKDRRTIYICGELTNGMASKFRKRFKCLESTSGDIVVELNTYGGDEQAGFLMADTIRLSQCNVITRATGNAMSMGAVILAAGHYREALPFTSIMIHQGTAYVRARVEELTTEVAELKKWEDIAWGFLDERTGHESGYWRSRCNGSNLYLDARQAVESGLVHRIAQ